MRAFIVTVGVHEAIGSFNSKHRRKAWEKPYSFDLQKELEDTISRYKSLLDLYYLTTPPTTYRKLGFEFDQSKQERLTALNPFLIQSERHPVNPTVNAEKLNTQSRFARFMANGQDKQRGNIWSYKIGLEAENFNKLGYYPFFITLTVDHNKIPHEYEGDVARFWRESRAYPTFRRRLARLAGYSMGMTKIEADKREGTLMSSIAVMEHGKTGNHHHIHMLVWMQEIPETWKIDPNQHNLRRNYMQCYEAKQYWEYGFSSFAYFRHIGDVWSRLGFKIPTKEGKQIKIASPFAAGYYLTKYLTKEQRAWSHRIKAPKNFGNRLLDKALQNLSLQELAQLTSYPEEQDMTRLKQKNNLPMSLLRQRAKSTLFSKALDSGSAYLKRLAKPTYKIYATLRDSATKLAVQPWAMPTKDLYAWLRSHVHHVAMEKYCKHQFFSLYAKLKLVNMTVKTRRALL